jgi:hypothetical protein
MPHDQRHPVTELEALTRRFEIIHINDLLKREGLRLRSKDEIKALKKNKNADFSKVFINIQEEQEALDYDRQVAEIREARNQL